MIADGAHVRRGANQRLENLSVNSNYVRENLSDVCCVNLCLGILVDFSCGFLKSEFIVPVDNCNHENTLHYQLSDMIITDITGTLDALV